MSYSNNISHPGNNTLQHSAGRLFGLARCFLFIGMLALAGNASAAITVDLSFNNDTDQFGNYTLIKNDKLKVNWEVTEDTDDDLHEKDKIQLVRVSDDEVLQSIQRERKGKSNGTVTIKMKDAAEQLYVQYVRKGNAGTVITRYAHPDDDGVSLQTINPYGGDDITTALHNLTSGAVSVQARAFHNEDQDAGKKATCIWRTTSNSYGFYDGTAGAETAACDPVAGVSLPHGRRLTEMHCTVYDNSASNSIAPDLVRVDLETGNALTVLSTATSTDNGSIQVVSDVSISANNAVIDNKRYAYSIIVAYSTSNFTTLDTDGRVYGCSIYYE